MGEAAPDKLPAERTEYIDRISLPQVDFTAQGPVVSLRASALYEAGWGGNAQVAVIDATHAYYLCTIELVDGQDVRLSVATKAASQAPCNVSLFFGLSEDVDGRQLHGALQTCAEIGVSRFVGFPHAGCTARESLLSDDIRQSILHVRSLAGWKGPAEFQVLNDFQSLVSELSGIQRTWVFWEQARRLPYSADVRPPHEDACASSLALVIGAPCGFSETEIDQLEHADATLLSLGAALVTQQTALVEAASLAAWAIQVEGGVPA